MHPANLTSHPHAPHSYVPNGLSLTIWLWALCLTLTLAALPTFAAPKLDYSKIKTQYKEGDFETIRVNLEGFLKGAREEAPREDQIVAYKYLGVIYASKDGGKPQAEAYFFRLLDLAPKVNLNELYVSSSVDQIFRETKERFQAEKQAASSVDEFGNTKESDDLAAAMSSAAKKNANAELTPPATEKAPIHQDPKPQAKMDKGRPVWPWILGAAVVGGGVGAYFMTAKSPSANSERLVEVSTDGK